MDDVYLLEQPVHVPGDGEALRVLRTDAARHPRARDLADPAQGAADKPSLPADRRALQRAVRRRVDRRPHRLPALHEAVRRRTVGRRLARRLGGGVACAVRRVGRADDAPADGARGLRRLRALALDRRGDDVDVVRPFAADARPLPGAPRLPHPGARRRGHHDLAARECVLPLGVQLVRDDRQGRHRVPDRLRERIARRRSHLAALLLPVGDQGARQLVGVLHRHPPRDARQPELARLLRVGRPRRPELRREAREVSRARGRVLPGRRSTRSSARRISGTSTRSRTSGSRPRSSTTCSSTPSARRSRRTSTSTSSPTTAGCSQPGRATRASRAARPRQRAQGHRRRSTTRH